jgi:hypothetical protein
MDNPKRIGYDDIDFIRYGCYGSLFIVGVNATLFPLDTITTIRMANNNTKLNISVFQLVKNMLYKEGISRFWRGVFPTVLGALPGQITYYSVYEITQKYTQNLISGDEDANVFLRGFISGASAELAGGLFYVPADVVTQRLQVQNNLGFSHNCRLYNGTTDIIGKILKYEGCRGFYRGYLAYLAAYAPGSAVQWGSYELAKKMLFSMFRIFEKNTDQKFEYKEQIVNAASGGLSAACAVSANNPLEVLRIRLQLLNCANPRHGQFIKEGYIPLFVKMYKEEGWKVFYKGVGVRLFMAVPTAMLAMSGYETAKAWAVD